MGTPEDSSARGAAAATACSGVGSQSETLSDLQLELLAEEEPSATGEEVAAEARRKPLNLGQRAYRRPLTQSEEDQIAGLVALAQSDMKRGGGVKRLMPAWNGCYVFGGPSASVTPRASSGYPEFPVLEKIMSTFPSYTIATAPAASKRDLGQNVPEVVLGVATKGNEWAMTVRSAA